MKLPEIDMNPVMGRPYPETTMFGVIAESAKRVPNAPALDFMGKITTFSEFVKKIEQAAGAFLNYGIKEGDKVTICMPNTPQGIICLYALNRIGAVANMVHPLSSKKNITFYLDYSGSKMILTLDQFYEKVKAAVKESETNADILVARIQDELPLVKAIAYKYLKNKENNKFPTDKKKDLVWTEFVKTGEGVKLPEIKFDKNRGAAILYSGGTSGTPKGILLSDFNFNALGVQISEIAGCKLDYGCKFLSVMPIFHGFGLGIGIHTVLQNGAMCILIPQFTKETYAKAVIKNKPNFIAGVPTLYEALLKVDLFDGKDLSFLIGVFSGGDSLSPELKNRADKFFKEHNASVQIREGYGLTECVTASCVTPVDRAKEGSIGLPLRDMEYRIVEPGTFNEVKRGEMGEIIISGPTLMLGYIDAPEENAKTLRTDENGTVWMFSGDMGYMDEEGFIYFKQRIKRLIVTSGYNVYPTHLENILDKHPAVDYSCVIGVKDSYKMKRIRAYIVLKNGEEASEETKKKILEYCKEYLDVFERPKEIIFKDELPKTLVGKVAYRLLEEEAEKEVETK
ncbi:MAG: acyl--CoA ligase [Clostridia bacterium]|nr:acyl--CoA ligase [Clostridia bacterium]